ncbi:MAG: hypothetical protein PVH65_07390, partial [Chloroflexota bacterium]
MSPSRYRVTGHPTPGREQLLSEVKALRSLATLLLKASHAVERSNSLANLACLKGIVTHILNDQSDLAQSPQGRHRLSGVALRPVPHNPNHL